MSQETYNAEAIIDDYSPLGAPVKKRAYTSHKITEDEIVTPLEEPSFTPPSFNDFDDTEETSKTEPRPFNEEYSQLDGKEKTMGAEMMAEMTIDLYAKGCGLLGKVGEISEAKIDRHIAEGSIDPEITIPTENGEVGIKEFASEYNQTVKDAFHVDDEFKEKVKPVLVRVYKKKGIGMTDTQLLLYYGSMDLAPKLASAVALRKTSNNILEALISNTQALRESRAPQPQPKPTEPAPQPTQPTPSTRVEPEEEFTEKISEVVEPTTTARRPTPKKPKTPVGEQLEYFEPEEDSVYDNLKSRGGFAQETTVPSNMPSFGDPEILSGIDKIAKKSRATKKVVLRKVPTRKNSKNN